MWFLYRLHHPVFYPHIKRLKFRIYLWNSYTLYYNWNNSKIIFKYLLKYYYGVFLSDKCIEIWHNMLLVRIKRWLWFICFYYIFGIDYYQSNNKTGLRCYFSKTEVLKAINLIWNKRGIVKDCFQLLLLIQLHSIGKCGSLQQYPIQFIAYHKVALKSLWFMLYLYSIKVRWQFSPRSPVTQIQ